MDKIVKLATKPKRAAPKAKYIDPIVQTSFAQDGSLQEVVKSLNSRLRDDNSTVVLKSLLVIHTLLRSGSLETTYSYLAPSSTTSSPLNTLSSLATDSANLSSYATYLHSRLKSFSNLKRDVIRDKSERKSAAGERLRKLGVEGGLLREVREVQRMIASLVEAKFYLDDIDDDVSMTALRLLVKDLLILFQAVNEGVINVLEHYFEMSHPDATTALRIYKTFCRDTERVVAYLSVAKKLQNVLNVPIPNLRHAPVSLAGSLEEYLNDPNFATNREEYKENKRIADGGTVSKQIVTNKSSTPATVGAPANSATTPSTSTAAVTNPTAFTDFFESIETAQTSMFNPASDSPTTQYFQQQATYNPFQAQQQQQMMTGMGMGNLAFGGAGMGMPGMMVPQATGMGYAAFGQPPAPFSQPQMYQYPQNTGFAPPPPQMAGFLQPQMTGANPFRQTMQPTGMALGGGGGANQPFGSFGQAPQQPQSFPFAQGPVQQQQQQQQSAGPFAQPPRQLSQSQSQPSVGQSNQANQAFNNAFAPTTTNTPAPLLPQATGSRNPFAPAQGERPRQPSLPLAPSMGAMAFSAFGTNPSSPATGMYANGGHGTGSGGYTNQVQTQPFARVASPLSQSQAQSQSPAALRQYPAATGMMGSVASDFAFRPTPTPSASLPPSSPALPPAQQQPYSTSSFTTSTLPLQSQATGGGFGFSSKKPFVPSSAFGASLEQSLGPSPITVHNTGLAGNPFRPSSAGPGPAAGNGSSAFDMSAFGNAFATNNSGQSGIGMDRGTATGSLI